jgi:dTDP-4-dehydrorhamnose reductase
MLLGSGGQLGWELRRSLLSLSEVIVFDRRGCDLSKPESIPGLIKSVQPDIIVNAAAYTDVDKAEEEEELATVINGTSVGVIAEVAKKNNILFLHYSTDYVFDGEKKGAYLENDVPNPINAYGRSKLVGESAIIDVGCEYIIVRTSWVYASRGNNFVNTILRLAEEKDDINVIDDQFGCPIWARNLADISAHILCRRISQEKVEDTNLNTGIYHVTACGSTTWYGFAKEIISIAKDKDIIDFNKSFTVSPIKTGDYPVAAERPKNSRLDVNKIRKDFGVYIAGWETGLKLCLSEL